MKLDQADLNKLVFAILNALDSSEAWSFARRDPDALTRAAQYALDRVSASRLSPDDIEALRFARDMVCAWRLDDSPDQERGRRAMSVLDRLIAANTDRGGAE